MRFFEALHDVDNTLRYSMLLRGAKRGLVSIAINSLDSRHRVRATLKQLATALSIDGDGQLLNIVQFGSGIEDYMLTDTERFPEILEDMDIWSLEYPFKLIDPVVNFLNTGNVPKDDGPLFNPKEFRNPWPILRQGKYADTILFVFSDVLAWQDFHNVSGPDSHIIVSVI